MNGLGVAVTGCGLAFIAGAFVIDSVGEFLVGVAVMTTVAIFAASLFEATK